MSDLEHELTSLLNYHSVEGHSGTPDFILAKYMLACLEAYTEAVKAREVWYGRPEPARLGPADD